MAIVYMGSAGKASTYRVVLKGTHCTFNLDMVSVKKGGTVSIIVYPEAGYVLSLLSTSAPCEKAFELATNTITLSKITADVVVSVDYASWSADYAYTGTRESLLVPHTGYYEVEVAAGSGGVTSETGLTQAKGGYIKAICCFAQSQVLSIYCGGVGGNGGRPGAGGGGWGYGGGAAGVAGEMGTNTGYGYSWGGSGGGGGSRIGLEDNTVYVEASGGGGSSGKGSAGSSGGRGGAGGKGGGLNGGSGGPTPAHDWSGAKHPGSIGGVSALGAEKTVIATPGGNLQTVGYVKIKYLGCLILM